MDRGGTATQESSNPKPETGSPRPARRPPLAEIDTWELWQAWKRGDRRTALPWIGLLVGFCVVLAAMYSFFYFSTSLTDDTIARFVLTFVLVVGAFALWRRISPRRDFALAIVLLMLLVSGLAFLLWLVAYALSGWNAWAAIGGTVVLGIAGLLIGLPSLNAIARARGED